MTNDEEDNEIMFFAASDAIAAEKINMEMSIRSMGKSKQPHSDRSANKPSTLRSELNALDQAQVHYIGDIPSSNSSRGERIKTSQSNFESR